MKNEELDQLFKEQLADKEISPPSFIWDKIEKELAPKHKINWIRYAAILAIIFSSALTIFFVKNTKTLSSPEKNMGDKISNLAMLDNKITKETTNAEAPLKKTEHLPENIIKNSDVSQDKTQNKVSSSAYRVKARETFSTRQTIHIEEPLVENNLKELTKNTGHQPLITYHMVEAGPIQSLISFPEQEDNMLASLATSEDEALPPLINKIIDKIRPSARETPIKISKDNEGSIQIDFKNIFAKNKNKRNK